VGFSIKSARLKGKFSHPDHKRGAGHLQKKEKVYAEGMEDVNP